MISSSQLQVVKDAYAKAVAEMERCGAPIKLTPSDGRYLPNPLTWEMNRRQQVARWEAMDACKRGER